MITNSDSTYTYTLNQLERFVQRRKSRYSVSPSKSNSESHHEDITIKSPFYDRMQPQSHHSQQKFKKSLEIKHAQRWIPNLMKRDIYLDYRKRIADVVRENKKRMKKLEPPSIKFSFLKKDQNSRRTRRNSIKREEKTYRFPKLDNKNDAFIKALRERFNRIEKSTQVDLILHFLKKRVQKDLNYQRDIRTHVKNYLHAISQRFSFGFLRELKQANKNYHKIVKKIASIINCTVDDNKIAKRFLNGIQEILYDMEHDIKASIEKEECQKEVISQLSVNNQEREQEEINVNDNQQKKENKKNEVLEDIQKKESLKEIPIIEQRIYSVLNEDNQEQAEDTFLQKKSFSTIKKKTFDEKINDALKKTINLIKKQAHEEDKKKKFNEQNQKKYRSTIISEKEKHRRSSRESKILLEDKQKVSVFNEKKEKVDEKNKTQASIKSRGVNSSQMVVIERPKQKPKNIVVQKKIAEDPLIKKTWKKITSRQYDKSSNLPKRATRSKINTLIEKVNYYPYFTKEKYEIVKNNFQDKTKSNEEKAKHLFKYLNKDNFIAVQNYHRNFERDFDSFLNPEIKNKLNELLDDYRGKKRLEKLNKQIDRYLEEIKNHAKFDNIDDMPEERKEPQSIMRKMFLNGNLSFGEEGGQKKVARTFQRYMSFVGLPSERSSLKTIEMHPALEQDEMGNIIFHDVGDRYYQINTKRTNSSSEGKRKKHHVEENIYFKISRPFLDKQNQKKAMRYMKKRHPKIFKQLSSISLMHEKSSFI